MRLVFQSGWGRFPPLTFIGRIFDLPLSIMSTQEIIAELPKLSRAELEAVDAKLHELLKPEKHQAKATEEEAKLACAMADFSDKMLRLSAKVQGLPSDLARNHDHYLHGHPKR